MKSAAHLFFFWIAASVPLGSQPSQADTARPVPLQPMAQQARQLVEALNYLGQPLSASEQKAINAAIALPDENAAVEALERIFDTHVLVNVDISPESRVK
ncbi:hypothetical protein, partial [Nevskia soli]|uniref:hypothetical protein n=1 Tax=Nevskia soli TaxID=418856 RepID=UPI0015D7CCDF